MSQPVSKQAGGLIASRSYPHWLMIGFCAGALLLAVILEPARPGQTVVSLAGVPIPPLCGMKRGLGIDCPGCGLTRSWVSLAHGQLSDSLTFHRMGWLVMLYACCQILRHGIWLANSGARDQARRWGGMLDKAALPLGLLLILNWLAKLFF